MEEIVTAEEGALLRGETSETVRRWCRIGAIKKARKSGRIWLISKAELLAYEPPARGLKPKRPERGEGDGR